ncbi:MAG: M28 family metallopeptidase [Solirubrobacterales bacterium]
MSSAAVAVVCAVAVLIGACGTSDTPAVSAVHSDRFDAPRAFRLIERQVAIGHRPAGSPASHRLARILRRRLPGGVFEPVPGGLRNVVGTLPGPGPATVIGAHYDSEALPKRFVGANDSAAGTAGVVELARDLSRRLPAGHRQIRFVLFDGEEEPAHCTPFIECGLRGSKAYVAAHPGETGQMILLDYIANKGLRIPQEGNSDPALWAKLRTAAAQVGAAGIFPARGGAPILDDHVPFLQAGVPAIDLIDFSYRFKDTNQDTVGKLSVASLDAVGETVAQMIISG